MFRVKFTYWIGDTKKRDKIVRFASAIGITLHQDPEDARALLTEPLPESEAHALNAMADAEILYPSLVPA